MRVSWAMALAFGACGDDARPAVDGDVQVEVEVGVETEVEAETEAEVEVGVETEVEPEVIDWQVESGIYRLAGLDPELPSDDLDNLWALIGDGDFYGLGESIHSSGGFYAAKERIIRYLVGEHGLRVFAMETPRSAARNLEDFIQGGACDTDAVSVFGVDGGNPIFGVYVDDNTVALFRWLCEWNVAHADDRVHFFGFDAQQPAPDLAEIAAFTSLHGVTTTALDACDDGTFETYDAVAFEACMTAIDAVEVELSNAGDARAQATLALSFRSLRSWQGQSHFSRTNIRKSWEARDIAMADLFLAQLALDFAGQRAIVWAHNYHLAADHTAIRRTGFVAQAATFGSELRGRVGADYRAVAITAYRPGINWPGVGEDVLTELGTPSNAIERALYEHFDDAALLYDVASEWAPGDAEWELSQETMIMRDNYDAIVFLRDSPPMDAMLW